MKPLNLMTSKSCMEVVVFAATKEINICYKNFSAKTMQY